MANSKQLRASRRNLIWAAIVALATAIAWIAFGWKIGLATAVIVLAISEVIERRARAQRSGETASST